MRTVEAHFIGRRTVRLLVVDILVVEIDEWGLGLLWLLRRLVLQLMMWRVLLLLVEICKWISLNSSLIRY